MFFLLSGVGFFVFSRGKEAKTARASSLMISVSLDTFVQVLGDTDSSFEEAWEAGTLPGWSSGRTAAAAAAAAEARKGGTAAPRVLDLKK